MYLVEYIHKIFILINNVLTNKPLNLGSALIRLIRTDLFERNWIRFAQ
jgi:hypothetical protein